RVRLRALGDELGLARPEQPEEHLLVYLPLVALLDGLRRREGAREAVRVAAHDREQLGREAVRDLGPARLDRRAAGLVFRALDREGPLLGELHAVHGDLLDRQELARGQAVLDLADLAAERYRDRGRHLLPVLVGTGERCGTAD